MDNGQGRQYDVAHDRRILINTILDDAPSAPIRLLQNCSELGDSCFLDRLLRCYTWSVTRLDEQNRRH